MRTPLTITAKAYAIMPFVWSVGIIIGPAIGGYFATPASNFPDTILDNDLFRKFPYLLPNLICTGLMLISIVAGWLCLVETHPDMQPWSSPEDLKVTSAVTPLMATQGSSTMPAVDLRQESYGTFNTISEEEDEEEWLVKPDGTSVDDAPEQSWFTRRVMMLMIALGIFTYHSMTYDHLMPIFFQDERIPIGHETIANASSPFGNVYGSFAGGLGLTIQQCGVILAFNGIIALFVQAVVFPLAASWLGVWRTFVLVTILHPIAYFIVPFLALLPENLLYPGIYTSFTIRNVLSILDYPLLLILIKEASPSPLSLGKINGLAASTGAACRTVASPLAGLLYGIGDKVEFTALAWWASALVAVIGALQVTMIGQAKGHHLQHHVRPVFLPVDAAERARRRKSSVVRIRVQGEPGDSGCGTEEEGAFASRVYGRQASGT
ncbi:hypothetical protein LTR08_008618 [Meristemomyces frigidus]|nr:hypothetical protein LTR08_008618 [Meristemomyces frigidus]